MAAPATVSPQATAVPVSPGEARAGASPVAVLLPLVQPLPAEDQPWPEDPAGQRRQPLGAAVWDFVEQQQLGGPEARLQAIGLLRREEETPILTDDLGMPQVIEGTPPLVIHDTFLFHLRRGGEIWAIRATRKRGEEGTSIMLTLPPELQDGRSPVVCESLGRVDAVGLLERCPVFLAGRLEERATGQSPGQFVNHYRLVCGSLPERHNGQNGELQFAGDLLAAGWDRQASGGEWLIGLAFAPEHTWPEILFCTPFREEAVQALQAAARGR